VKGSLFSHQTAIHKLKPILLVAAM